MLIFSYSLKVNFNNLQNFSADEWKMFFLRKIHLDELEWNDDVKHEK